MEGLIPFVYKAIMQYKNGKQGPIGSWLCESPSYSYMKLPGDSGRFHTSASSLIGSDYGFSASSPSSMLATSSTQIIVSSSVQSPHRCVNSPRVPTWTSRQTCSGTWMWLLRMLLRVQVCLFKWFNFGTLFELASMWITKGVLRLHGCIVQL